MSFMALVRSRYRVERADRSSISRIRLKRSPSSEPWTKSSLHVRNESQPFRPSRNGPTRNPEPFHSCTAESDTASAERVDHAGTSESATLIQSRASESPGSKGS